MEMVKGGKMLLEQYEVANMRNAAELGLWGWEFYKRLQDARTAIDIVMDKFPSDDLAVLRKACKVTLYNDIWKDYDNQE